MIFLIIGLKDYIGLHRFASWQSSNPSNQGPDNEPVALP